MVNSLSIYKYMVGNTVSKIMSALLNFILYGKFGYDHTATRAATLNKGLPATSEL